MESLITLGSIVSPLAEIRFTMEGVWAAKYG
jgi:hypothetical protein